MIRTFCNLMIIIAFASCGGTRESNDNARTRNGSVSIEWPKGWPKEGFQPHNAHKYGFDISPNYPYDPTKISKTIAKEDSIVYMSILTGDIGYTNVFTDSGLAINFEYYYCDPDTYKKLFFLRDILASEGQKHELTINSSDEKIALCKTIGADTIKIQELHTYHYDLKNDYNFYAYTWGDKNDNSIRHQMIYDKNGTFWQGFDDVYGQAIVKHGKITSKFRETEHYDVYEGDKIVKEVDIKYILTRAKGSYFERCSKGDIDRFMDTIQIKGGLEGERRIIIQLGYPIKRFWPLQKKFNNDEIEICDPPPLNLTYDDNPKLKSTLRLEPIGFKDRNNNDCDAVLDVPVTWNSSENAWILDLGGGRTKIATLSDVNPDCAVLVDTATVDSVKYIEEIPTGSVAVAKDKGRATVVILPWLGDMTLKTGLHELGHTIGLTDVNDALLSTRITDEHMEGNLMHSSHKRKGRMLRNRGMVPSDLKEQSMSCSNKVDGKCVELQWDCLRKKSGACLLPNLDPYLR